MGHEPNMRDLDPAVLSKWGSPYVRLSGRLLSLPRVKAMNVLFQMVDPSLFVMPSITCSTMLFSPIVCQRSAFFSCTMAIAISNCRSCEGNTCFQQLQTSVPPLPLAFLKP